MKKFAFTFLKALLVVLYPIIVILLIVVSVMFFLRARDTNKALDTYGEMHEEFGFSGSEEKDIRKAMSDVKGEIANIYDELGKKEDEIAELEDKVQEGVKEGYGEIKGNILAFVSEGSSLNTYQRVCAQNSGNASKQYCVSVSAIQKQYTLAVPEGEYYVFAQLQDEPTNTTKAYYSDFVKCNSDGKESCAAELSNNYILVSVKSGAVIEDVDPVDWKFVEKTEEKPVE